MCNGWFDSIPFGASPGQADQIFKEFQMTTRKERRREGEPAYLTGGALRAKLMTFRLARFTAQGPRNATIATEQATKRETKRAKERPLVPLRGLGGGTSFAE